MAGGEGNKWTPMCAWEDLGLNLPTMYCLPYQDPCSFERTHNGPIASVAKSLLLDLSPDLNKISSCCCFWERDLLWATQAALLPRYSGTSQIHYAKWLFLLENKLLTFISPISKFQPDPSSSVSTQFKSMVSLRHC